MYSLLQSILHIDSYLISLVTTYGIWIYFILFLIIFCETGLVVFPFLPGDSLLFAAGSLCAHQSLNFFTLMLVLIAASIIGNKINYLLGNKFGSHILKAKKQQNPRMGWLFNQNHLEKAHHFYIKHGGKTLILGRFMPIIRTFVPFVAGAAKMPSSTFAFYNITGAFLWIGSLLSLGFFFGNLPLVKDHFSLLIYSIIVISLLPALLAVTYRKFQQKA